ncbi:MAG: aspartate-semialdehyde dehydrogenase [Myxococcota bacterium]|jgi:aspartate-semialdehyde dehydrogenase
MRVGFIGWRGVVGSVLLDRMRAEGDFDGLEPTFFSTSNAGGLGPDVGHGPTHLADAHDLDALARLPVLVSCQGGAYTEATYPRLRDAGWTGRWIDAASPLRMAHDACLTLDPVNGEAVQAAIDRGVRTFVGANCTVSLLLMGLVGLIRTGHVEWISTMTYQAASGAGARHLRELVAQMARLGSDADALLADPGSAALDLDRQVRDTLRSADFPTAAFGAPLAASAIPWIDRAVAAGQTREEFKAMSEGNRLLGRSDSPLPIDGLCVRIGAMRCHAQAVTIKLDRELPLDVIEAHIAGAHPWVSVVPNTAEATVAQLTPAAVAGTLQVPVGRLRRMSLGPTFVTAFTVGDQLLWGAAEPLRRVLGMIRASG